MMFAAALAALAPAASHAGSVPRYDPVGWCETVASAGGGLSESIKETCLEQEQAAYDALKPAWAGLPAKSREWCDQVARTGGHGAYTILQTCIEQETESKQKNSETQFKF